MFKGINRKNEKKIFTIFDLYFTTNFTQKTVFLKSSI